MGHFRILLSGRWIGRIHLRLSNRDFPTISSPCCKREVVEESRSPPGYRKLLCLRTLGTRPLIVLKWIWKLCPRLRGKQAAGKRRHLGAAGSSSSESGFRETDCGQGSVINYCENGQVYSSFHLLCTVGMFSLQSCIVRVVIDKKVADSSLVVDWCSSVNTCEKHWVWVTLTCENMSHPLAHQWYCFGKVIWVTDWGSVLKEIQEETEGDFVWLKEKKGGRGVKAPCSLSLGTQARCWARG